MQGFFAAAPIGFMCKSGFLLVDPNKKDMQLMEPSPTWRARHMIPSNLEIGWRPHSTLLDHYLSTVHKGQPDEGDRVRLMGEIVFAALTGLGPRLKRAIMLQGQKGTGKSQLLDMLKSLVPERARCVIAPQLMGEEYDCASLAGKMLNIVTDIEAGEIIKEGSIKAIVHGEDVRGRNPSGRPFIVTPRALHVFSCNFWPAAPGVSEAFWDRWMALRFENHFRDTTQDIAEIGKQIAAQEIDGLVAWAVECGADLLARGRYTVPISTAEVMREWQAEGDSVAAWRAEATEPASDMSEKGRGKWWPAADAYQNYKEWCGKNGYRGVVNSTNFGRRLKGGGVAHHRSNSGILYAIASKTPPPDFL